MCTGANTGSKTQNNPPTPIGEFSTKCRGRFLAGKAGLDGRARKRGTSTGSESPAPQAGKTPVFQLHGFGDGFSGGRLALHAQAVKICSLGSAKPCVVVPGWSREGGFCLWGLPACECRTQARHGEARPSQSLHSETILLPKSNSRVQCGFVPLKGFRRQAASLD